MRLKKKQIVLLVLLGLLLVTFTTDNLLRYGLRQGLGQAKILVGAQSVESVLGDPLFPDSLKTKIQLVQAAKLFAVDSLELVRNENYTELYDQKGKPILWVVSASEAFQLKEHTWWYPLIGEMGYKGFFLEELANNEADKLREKGLDVSVSTVSAWSTLGFFNDPILSNTLTKSEGELADLIIHELTHATLFVKDDAEFNENLASFIGNQGALQFLAHYYGSESQQYLDYARFISDQDELTHFYVAAAKSLDSLYFEMSKTPTISYEEKQRLKEHRIRKIMNERKALDLFSFKYSPWQEGDELPNNTFFTGFLMYRSNQNDLKSELENKFDGNLRLFIRSYVERYGNSGVQL